MRDPRRLTDRGSPSRGGSRADAAEQTGFERPRPTWRPAVGLELMNATRSSRSSLWRANVWPDTVATAALVSTLQEFRDLFSSEVLAPGCSSAIEQLAFMFTDLTGSTALYQAIGQARAFRLVQDHFRVLGQAISAHRGAIVKTIGDAVMAVFPTAPTRWRPPSQMQRDIRRPRRTGRRGSRSAGQDRPAPGALHRGDRNDRLDYFGTTVNTAARIEHECRGGQIVASLALCRAPAAAAVLGQAGRYLEEEVVRLRSVADPLPIYRVTPP